MSDLLERLGAIDSLALIFILGGLASVWGFWKLLSDNLDLRTPPAADASESATPGSHAEDAPGRRAA